MMADPKATTVVVQAKSSSGVKRVKSMVPPKHPKYGDMVKRAILALKEPRGSSRVAIHKYIVQNFQIGSNPKLINVHLRMALKRAVIKGALIQVKGVGASGSFKISASKSMKVMKKAVKKTKSTKTRSLEAKSGAKIAQKKIKPPKVVVERSVSKTASSKKPLKGRKLVPAKRSVIKLKKMAPKRKIT